MPKDKTLYGWSEDGEIWYGVVADRDEAFRAARHAIVEHERESMPPGVETQQPSVKGIKVYTCRCMFPKAEDYVTDRMFCVDTISEGLDDRAADMAVHVPEGEPLFELDEAELETYLVDCLRAYFKVKKLKPTQWSAEEVKEHILE